MIITLLNLEKLQYLSCIIGTVVIKALSSLDEGSFEITPTVPLIHLEITLTVSLIQFEITLTVHLIHLEITLTVPLILFIISSLKKN